MAELAASALRFDARDFAARIPMKLTQPMMTALRRLNSGNPSPGDFRTMEALRKRGLADRFTTHAILGEYVTKDESMVNYRSPARKPHLLHEWYTTKAGLDAEI